MIFLDQQQCDTLMYADDTTLYCNLDSIPKHRHDIVLRNELNHVHDWLACNKLSLNVSKTKCMIFHTNHRKFVYPNLTMNDEIIERVTSFNFLGLMLSANLSWDVHTSHISRKVSRAIGVIKSLKYAFPIETLITIYNTLLLCHFNYCLTVWGSNTDKLFRLQKKAIRIISNNSYLTHTDPIFKRLGLLKINDIYILRVLKLYYKLKHNVLPPLFNDMLPRISIGSTR